MTFSTTTPSQVRNLGEQFDDLRRVRLAAGAAHNAVYVGADLRWGLGFSHAPRMGAFAWPSITR
jgi:hypothetical protein